MSFADYFDMFGGQNDVCNVWKNVKKHEETSRMRILSEVMIILFKTFDFPWTTFRVLWIDKLNMKTCSQTPSRHI